MELSKNNKINIYASKKGYVVDKNGDVFFNGRKRKLIFDSAKYYTFTIRWFDDENNKNVLRRVWVHKLQAYQKYGMKIFKKGIQVRHFNGNELDNSHDNILIGTASMNSMDRPEEKRISMAINASYKNRILTDEQVKELIKDRSEGMSYGKLMTKYNISSKGTISYMIQKSSYFKNNNEENNNISN